MSTENVQRMANTGGSLADAVDMMPDVEAMERGSEVPARDEAGRFLSGKAQPTREEVIGEKYEEQTTTPAPQAGDSSDEGHEEEQQGQGDERPSEDEESVSGQADGSEAEEEWLEIAGEEGQDPVRLSVDEVYQGYERAKELEAEVENLRQTTPAPPDYDSAIMDAINKGQEYLQGLKQVEAMLQPFEPDQNLINPGSPTYDPEAYFNQQQYAQQQKAHLEAVQKQRVAAEEEVIQRESAVAKARFEREQQKLMEMWPELKEEANANAVRDEASRFYGLDNQTLDSVHDSRFYAVLKDALAYRKQQGTSKKAVRKVKSKPKLVKGGARDSESPQQRSRQEGMKRLMETGTRQAAMDALDGLLD